MGEELTLYIANRICKEFLLIHKKKRQPKRKVGKMQNNMRGSPNGQ